MYCYFLFLLLLIAWIVAWIICRLATRTNSLERNTILVVGIGWCFGWRWNCNFLLVGRRATRSFWAILRSTIYRQPLCKCFTAENVWQNRSKESFCIRHETKPFLSVSVSINLLTKTYHIIIVIDSFRFDVSWFMKLVVGWRFVISCLRTMFRRAPRRFQSFSLQQTEKQNRNFLFSNDQYTKWHWSHRQEDKWSLDLLHGKKKCFLIQ